MTAKEMKARVTALMKWYRSTEDVVPPVDALDPRILFRKTTHELPADLENLVMLDVELAKQHRVKFTDQINFESPLEPMIGKLKVEKSPPSAFEVLRASVDARLASLRALAGRGSTEWLSVESGMRLMSWALPPSIRERTRLELDEDIKAWRAEGIDEARIGRRVCWGVVLDVVYAWQGAALAWLSATCGAIWALTFTRG
ncbi:MAG: hypothetical protein AAGI54_00720 [Planctomycetota bacterium]